MTTLAPTSRLAALAICALLTAGALLGSAAPSAQTWEAAPAMASPRTGAAWAVFGGRLSVFGGRLAGGTQLRSAEVFDPATGWTPLPQMDHVRLDGRAVVLDGAIYVMGGREGTEPSDEVEVFRPDLNRWASAPHMDESRVGHAVGVVGGDIYVVGGAGRAGNLRTAERYRAGRWEAYPPWGLPVPRALAGSATLGASLVIAGGFGPSGPLALVDRYVPDQPSTPLPPLRRARGGVGVAADGQALFAVGGRDAGNVRVADAERLDAGAGAWAALPALPEGREGAVVAVLGADLYVVGGTTDFGTVLASAVRLPRVAVGTDDAPVAASAALALAGPNPARGDVRLRVTLAEAQPVTVALFDVRGRCVATLAAGTFGAGARDVTWDARALPAGLYAARLTTPTAVSTVRIALVR